MRMDKVDSAETVETSAETVETSAETVETSPSRTTVEDGQCSDMMVSVIMANESVEVKYSVSEVE